VGYQQGFMQFGGGGVYPEMSDSLGMTATSAPAEASGAEMGGAARSSGNAMPANMLSANPIGGGIVLIVLLVAIMLIVHKFGSGEGDFSNLKASFYNVVIVALVATTGIPLIKAGFNALAGANVPGANHLAAYANAA